MSIIFKGVGTQTPIHNLHLYSDGTPMVKTDQWADIVDSEIMILRPQSLQEFTVGMYLVDAIYYAGGDIKYLILPYLPGARQDRSNPTGDVLFTSMSVVSDINARRFDSVVVLDPHSDAMPPFLNGCVEYPLELVYKQLQSRMVYDGIVAPDKGAAERARLAAATLGTFVYQGSKVRDVSTGRLSNFELEVEPGKHYLVVDDICDGGFTFRGIGELIRNQGSTADLFVTHGIFSNGTKELEKIYDTIYTTDSRIIHERNNVTVLSVVKDMERLV
jgi:ribose-phosphate pyrophosphokinase